jgi:UDP:flavonoid glycosyltransferase YjiC (YdhE family)
MPSAPLRLWVPAPRARLQAADCRVLNAINQALAAFGAKPVATIGDLFAARTMLLTYPELDIYPERGPADYYGITDSAEGREVPAWPRGDGPRVFVYLYHYYQGLAPLAEALASGRCPTLALCRGIDPRLKEKHKTNSVYFSDEPMSVSRLLPQADIVVCHGSHQMTAQALLAGKPLLLLPTQLEQFLIMRRLVRYGAGLGISPDAPGADYASALRALSEKPKYAARAREFRDRYAGHSRAAALATMLGRIESALRPGSGPADSR